MKTIRVRLTFTEGILGTASSCPDLYAKYIASKLEGNPNENEELKAVQAAAEETADAGPQTVFPRNENGEPIIYDYQIKGYFKDTCSLLRKVKGTESSKVKAYKKEIDGLIFPSPRMITIHTSGAIKYCTRPLRASTPQGERISLAKSEEIPEGSYIEFDILLLNDDHQKLVEEWLEYGKLRGIGQWRNSGKGRFETEYID